MSWGIDFKADIFLSRQSYDNKLQVDDRIRELNEDIKELESEIKMYASATPKDIITEETDSVISSINRNLDDVLERYNEYLLDMYRLQLYLEYLNDHEIINAE